MHCLHCKTGRKDRAGNGNGWQGGGEADEALGMDTVPEGSLKAATVGSVSKYTCLSFRTGSGKDTCLFSSSDCISAAVSLDTLCTCRRWRATLSTLIACWHFKSLHTATSRKVV